MRLIFHSQLSRSKNYRADIDGLRAIAVLPVVFYHASVGGFSGGYVGVDIFYVISGYLITSLIARDIAVQRFSFVSFYERRIRRIFPAVFGVMLFCAAIGAVLLTPKDLVAFAKSMVAMTFFASNLLFTREGGAAAYFGDASKNQVLLHTWSLSVEEQFYLFFPVLLFLLTRCAKKWRSEAILVIAAVSFLISLWAVQHRPLAAFYHLVPRAWELLIGALLALQFVPALTHRVLRELAGILGLAMIGWAVFSFSDSTPFPGIYAVAPCLGAWLVIYAGETGSSWVKSILSLQPLVFIGVISYSLYLWHWPLIMFSRYFSVGTLSSLQTWLIILCSGAIGFLSFEFIEAPFRGGDSVFNRRQIFLFGASVSSLSAAIGLAVYLSHGLPERYNSATRQLVLQNTERKDDYDEVCGNWKKEVRMISDIDSCTLGPASSKKIMFWGDSHVQQLYPLVKELYDSGQLRGRGVVMSVSNGCLPSERLNALDGGFHCNRFTRFAMQRAEEPDVDTVFIGFATWFAIQPVECLSINDKCVGKISPAEATAVFSHELTQRIRELKAQGKRVIVSLPFPIYDKSIPDTEIRDVVFGRFGLETVAKELSLLSVRSDLASLAKANGAELFDPRSSLCHDEACVTQVNGVSIYKDSHHLAASQLGILRASLEHVLASPSPTIALSFAKSSPLTHLRLPRE